MVGKMQAGHLIKVRPVFLYAKGWKNMNNYYKIGDEHSDYR